MSEDNDTAMRLIASFIKHTMPGQLELPLDWISDDSKDDVIKNNINEFNKKAGESTVTGKIFEADEKLQDAELLKKKDESMEKDKSQTLGFTGFVSAKENNNDGSDRNGNITSKSEKDMLETKSQRFGHVLCKFFREGNCCKGDTCCYSHDAADSRHQPKLCKDYKYGTCKQGSSCPYFHGEHPCEDFVFGHCDAFKCRYSHQRMNDFTKPIFEKILVKAKELNAFVPADIGQQILQLSSSSYGRNSVNYSSKFSNHQSRSFSSSSTNAIRTNHSSSYNKNSFRHPVTHHPYKKPYKSASKPKNPPLPLQNISTVSSNYNIPSGVTFNLPYIRRSN